jgi:hypothetical protein
MNLQQREGPPHVEGLRVAIASSEWGQDAGVKASTLLFIAALDLFLNTFAVRG